MGNALECLLEIFEKYSKVNFAVCVLLVKAVRNTAKRVSVTYVVSFTLIHTTGILSSRCSDDDDAYCGNTFPLSSVLRCRMPTAYSARSY